MQILCDVMEIIWGHLHYIWNTTMAAWFHLGINFMITFWAWAVSPNVTRYHENTPNKLFLNNYQVLKHSNSCLNKIWECTQKEIEKIGNKAILYTGRCFTVVKASSPCLCIVMLINCTFLTVFSWKPLFQFRNQKAINRITDIQTLPHR